MLQQKNIITLGFKSLKALLVCACVCVRVCVFVSVRVPDHAKL